MKKIFETRFNNSGTFRALHFASRQLELCGWCPKEENNDLDKHFYVCELARKNGVRACHDCITEYFLQGQKEVFG